MDPLEAHARLRWLYRTAAGEQGGPLTTTEVIERLLAKSIPIESMLCEDGTEQWREARAVEQFRIAARAVRASIKRRASDPPSALASRKTAPSESAQSPLDEEEIKTKCYEVEGSSGLAAASSTTERGADEGLDEEDIKTKYYAADDLDQPMPAVVHEDDSEEDVQTKFYEGEAARKASSSVSPAEQDEEELKTAFFHPGGQAAKQEEQEQDVRTKYYQKVAIPANKLPTFEDLAAAERKRVEPTPAPSTALQPAIIPSAPLNVSLPSSYVSVAPPTPLRPPIPPRTGSAEITALVQLPIPSPVRSPPSGPSWWTFALVAAIGAIFGLLVVLVIAITLRAPHP